MIRLATPADADELADLYLGSRKRHVAFAPLVHSDAEVRRWIRQTLIPRPHVWVLVHQQRLAGMLAMSRSESVSWIDQLYVHPEMTAQGFGTQLMRFAQQELPPPIQLHTFRQNWPSRFFYEKHGFVPVLGSDGADNEERCPDLLYRWPGAPAPVLASRK